MAAATTETAFEITVTDKAYAELTRLFNIYRIAHLNVLYYGKRANRYMQLQRWTLILIAAFSATALALLLGPDDPIRKGWAIGLAGASGVIAAVLPSMGWSDGARDLHFLHVAYGMLSSQLELTMVKIKKSADLTPELEGEAQTLYETFSRLEPMDEKFPNKKVIEDLDKQIRVQFPTNYIWNNL